MSLILLFWAVGRKPLTTNNCCWALPCAGGFPLQRPPSGEWEKAMKITDMAVERYGHHAQLRVAQAVTRGVRRDPVPPACFLTHSMSG